MLGGHMFMRSSYYFVFIAFLGFLLVGCASSETRSLLSADDIPSTRYKKIAVFVENVPDSERSAAEQVVASALQNAGVDATTASSFFARRARLDEKQKALIVQRQFDAVLYLSVLEQGETGEVIPGASHNGNAISFYRDIVPGFFGAAFTTDIGKNLYSLNPDGSVSRRILAMKTKVDLQDTKTAKLVWTSETISSGDANVTKAETLFAQASSQIVAKLRDDSVI